MDGDYDFPNIVAYPLDKGWEHTGIMVPEEVAREWLINLFGNSDSYNKYAYRLPVNHIMKTNRMEKMFYLYHHDHYWYIIEKGE